MGLSIMMCLGDLAYVSKMKTKPGWEALSIKELRIWIWLIDLTHHQDTKQPPKTFQILSKHPPINFKPSRSRFSTVREKAEWYGDNACRIKWRLCQTWNTSKTFRERKIWAKIFHKSSVIFDIFVKQIMRDFDIFGMINCHLRASRSIEYMVQLQTLLKLSQLYIHIAHCVTKIILLSVLWKTLNLSLCVV